MCCNNQKPRKEGANNTCKKSDKNKWSCPNAGVCCARSDLMKPETALMESCSVCNIYNPCDQDHCAARPDKIRNAQVGRTRVLRYRPFVTVCLTA